MDGFYVVVVGVEHVGCVVGGVVAALAGRAIVAASCGERRLVEPVDGCAVRSLDGEMDARNAAFVGRIHPQFVAEEVALSFVDNQIVAQGGEGCAVKRLLASRSFARR